MVEPAEIIRSKRKTLALSIDGTGRLIVRAPLRCGEEKIYQFIREKEGWILRKQAEKQNAGVELPSENLDGYELLLLGRKCKIQVLPIDKVGYDAERQRIYLPEKNPKERLVKWLKENAKRIFSSVSEQTAKKMGVSYKSVSVTSARGRWGSCSHDNALRYTFRLLFAPKEVVEYVVVHELAHVLHKNHSKAFWATVEKYVPDWKEKRNWLHTHNALMKVL
ncbi:MAG: M48 family metallopeptidase [Clostridia bacterium]|nr:M48 family metallopeptidase [Clostridia bacterium]